MRKHFRKCGRENTNDENINLFSSDSDSSSNNGNEDYVDNKADDSDKVEDDNKEEDELPLVLNTEQNDQQAFNITFGDVSTRTSTPDESTTSAEEVSINFKVEEAIQRISNGQLSQNPIEILKQF